MDTLHDLLTGRGAAHSIFLLSLIVSLGVALGRLRVFSFRLGVSGVLFVAVVFGHFGWTIEKELLEFTREFGLILFVYTIGLQLGPGFLAVLRRSGLLLNLLAAGGVSLGFAIAATYAATDWFGPPAVVGLFSGGTTNTPSLAAGLEVLRSVPGTPPAALQVPGMAYAIAYPFGIVGTISAMVTLRAVFRIDISEQARLFEERQAAESPPLGSVDLNVENPNLEGLRLRDIPVLKQSDVVVSRILHAGVVQVATPDTVVHQGDIIHAVGQKASLADLALVVGSESQTDLRSDVPSNITSRQIVVTRTDAVGRTVALVSRSAFSEVRVTRVSRAGIEFPATAQTELQFADVLTVVGDRETLTTLATALGDSKRDLDLPQLIPLFVGLCLGVVAGSLPLAIPGLPAKVKLGLAGGPLVVALVLSRLGHIGRVVWWMPAGSNLMLREFGIALFLACVGLASGERFWQTLWSPTGLWWLAAGALITAVPLVTVALAGYWMRINYLTLCGVLAGSMTDPPALAFASTLARCNAAALAYATVYPLTMILRVLGAQMLVLLFAP